MIEPWHVYGISFIICMIAAKLLIYFDDEKDTAMMTFGTVTPVLNTIITMLIVCGFLVFLIHFIVTWVPKKDES